MEQTPLFAPTWRFTVERHTGKEGKGINQCIGTVISRRYLE